MDETDPALYIAFFFWPKGFFLLFRGCSVMFYLNINFVRFC